MFLKFKNIIFKIRRSKVTDYAALSLVSFYGTLANSAEPDQMLQNAASGLVLHCLLTEYSFKI